MNFLHFLTLLMVISSTCNCEVVKSSTNANSTGYHLSVPTTTRITTMSMAVLFLSATVWCTVTTFLLAETFEFSTTVSAVIFTIATVFLAVLFTLLGRDLSFFAINFSPDRPPLPTKEFDILSTVGCMIVSFLCGYLEGYLANQLRYLTVSFAINLLLSLLIDFGVYKEMFSAFILLGIVMATAIVGAKLISTRLGQTLWNVATVNLMLIVNVKLLVTLNSTLNDGKSIWPLSITVIKTVLIIFAIRSISIAYICRWARIQYVVDIHISFLLLLAFQLSFNCVVGYLIALLYSLYAN